MFVALGSPTRTSPDGITWTAGTQAVGGALAYSVDLHLFVAVTVGGVCNTSPDGVTWTARADVPGANTVSSTTYQDVIWAAGLGLFVAVGLNDLCATSPDGITWTTRVRNGDAKAVAWSPELGLLVAVGDSVDTSPDGVTWTTRSSAGDSVAWSGPLGLFTVVWPDEFGVARFSTSSDGVTWTARATKGSAYRHIIWADGVFVAVGDSTADDPGKPFATSPDGITWTLRAHPVDFIGTARLAYSPTVDRFVVLDGTRAATSPDGVTWTARANVAAAPVVWAELNRPPNAPILTTMADGGSVPRGSVNRAAHDFSDPDTGDSQSAFFLRYRIIGAPSWTTLPEQVTPNQWYDFPASSLAVGNYERQVATKDALGVLGPYSPSGFFTAATAPAGATITDPINGATIGAATYTATFSAPNVDASQWRTVADNAGSPDETVIYQDSGVIESTTLRSYTLSFPVTGRTEHIQVRIRNGGLWSPWASSSNPVSYTPPDIPTFSVTPDAATGSVLITITNPPTPPVRTNGCPNPRLGVNTTGWSGTGGTRVAQGAGWAFQVDGSVAPYLIPPTVAVALGQFYSASVVLVGPAGRTVNVSLNDAVTGDTSPAQSIVLTDAPQTVTLMNSAATDQTTLRIVVYLAATGGAWTAGQMLTATDALIEQVSGVGVPAGAYFDGATTDVSPLVHAWTGTPDASTSTETDTTPPVSYNDIEIDDGAGLERFATAVAANGSWPYWTPVSGRYYAAPNVQVIAVGDNGTSTTSA